MQKENCLFFGNCNMYCIKEILNTCKFKEYFNLFCYSTHLENSKEDKEKLFTELKHYSVIILQPHYTVEEYTIDKLVKYTNRNCKIIILSVAYFNFYYPNLTYAKNENNEMLSIPSHYHDKLLISLYNNKNNDIIETYVNCVKNKNYFDTEYLENLASESISELQKREHACMSTKYEHPRKYIFITLSTFIKNNYKKELLFYSVNHPTYFLFEYICNEILTILDLHNLCYTFQKKDLLYLNDRVILYKSIQNAVDFDIEKYSESINNNSNITDIVNMYLKEYESYTHILLK